MIRIIEAVYIKRVGDEYVVWSALPIVPGTGKVTIEKKKEDAGRMQIVKFSAACKYEHTWLYEKLLVKIFFDEGPLLELGCADIPILFSSSLAQNALEVSFEYRSRLL